MSTRKRPIGGLEYVSCALCGFDVTHVRFMVSGYRIVECEKCGLVYVNPRTPSSVYTDAYFSDPRYYMNYEASRAAFRIGFRRKVEMIRRFCPRGRLLDVGCAYGDFMGEANARGFVSSGVEIVPSAARQAASIGPVFIGSWWDFPIQEAPFDVVTFIDTLEHLEDPLRALQRAHSVLVPGGIVALMVPNIDSWFARLTGKHWHLLLPEEHLYYFTRRTLLAFLEVANFSPLLVTTAGYGRSVADIASVLLRGSGLESLPGRFRWFRQLAWEIKLGDLFVVAQKR